MVEEKLDGSSMFIVELSVSSSNQIHIELDGMEGVSIDDCVGVSRHVEHNLDRESEDFELHVSSAGLDKPLRDKRQYVKNIGRNLKVTLTDGTVVKGKLTSVDEGIELSIPANKKKKLPERLTSIAMDEMKEAKIEISFK